MEQWNKVRGIAHDRNVAKVTLVDVPDRPGIARSVFGPLADNASTSTSSSRTRATTA